MCHDVLVVQCLDVLWQIRSSLAKILRISLRLVSRPTIMAGSVVLRVVLPVAAANKLSAMIASGKLKNIGGVGVSKAKVCWRVHEA